jgi:IS5 family transposase
VSDVTVARDLVHGEESDVFGDAGYQGVQNREENVDSTVKWYVAMRPGKRRALGDHPWQRMLEEIEHCKAQIRAKAEHAFCVIKRQFGYAKVRYRGLAKNTPPLHTLFALSNLWMARRALLDTG